MIGPLFVLQRQLHREIQAVFLLLTKRIEISLVLFSVLFFPGVLLHESSHWLAARLLGIRTGRFSLLPRPLNNGRLQLGYVETSATDILRDAIIGAAPLLAGGAFVAYAGWFHLGLQSVWQSVASGDTSSWSIMVKEIAQEPDYWLWFYLTFAVSSTMLPSSSDRRAWLPLTLVGVLLLGGILLFGAGPWMAEHLAAPLNSFLRVVSLVFGITVILHLLLLVPTWMLRRLLNIVTGLEIA